MENLKVVFMKKKNKVLISTMQAQNFVSEKNNDFFFQPLKHSCVRKEH